MTSRKRSPLPQKDAGIPAWIGSLAMICLGLPLAMVCIHYHQDSLEHAKTRCFLIGGLTAALFVFTMCLYAVFLLVNTCRQARTDYPARQAVTAFVLTTLSFFTSAFAAYVKMPAFAVGLIGIGTFLVLLPLANSMLKRYCTEDDSKLPDWADEVE